MLSFCKCVSSIAKISHYYDNNTFASIPKHMCIIVARPSANAYSTFENVMRYKKKFIVLFCKQTRARFYVLLNRILLPMMIDRLHCNALMQLYNYYKRISACVCSIQFSLLLYKATLHRYSFNAST